jgi:nicotinamide-nucleotide amidase
MTDIQQAQSMLIKQLKHRRLRLATAESCTGGLIAKLITDTPGSSAWFEAAIVSYSNDSKNALLDIDEQLIANSGAVSQSVVEAMARSVITKTNADVAIAVSGIAGPDGGTAEKPLGMVWIAFADRHGAVQSQVQLFKGDREQVREQAASSAMQGLSKFIVKNA